MKYSLAFVLALFFLSAANPEVILEESILPIDGRGLQIFAGLIVLAFFMFGFVLYYFIFNKSADEAIAGMKELDRPAQFTKKNGKEN